MPVKETFTTPIRLYTEVVLMFPDYILHDRGVSVLCLTVPLMMGFAEVKYRSATKLRVLPRRYGQDDVHGVQKGTSPYRGGEARVARAPSSTQTSSFLIFQRSSCRHSWLLTTLHSG